MNTHRTRSRYTWRELAILAAICFVAGLVAAWTSDAHAQNTLTFSASTTTGDGTVIPVLTWSTSPPAQSCTASGAPNWSGTKAASGTQTLPPITSSATYNLSCTWPGDSIATLTWVNPTTNTDGSAYTDAKETRLRYRLGSSGAYTEVVHTPGTSAMRTITGLTSVGTYEFLARACNQRDVCSADSNAASKTFTGNVTVNRSVGVTVNPVPSVITGFSAE